MSGDINKLPKWARDEILGLQRDLAAATERLSSMEGVPSRIQVEGLRMRGGSSPNDVGAMYLPDRTTVTYDMGGGASIDVDLRDEGLAILGSGSGEPMMILPRSSNHVWVVVRKEPRK